MTEIYKQQLKQVRVDLTNALDRFMGSEALYEKFLQKFLQDETFIHLEESIHGGDADKAFMYAHTMKGLAANLEMGNLLEILKPITDQLRNGQMDGVPEQLQILKSRYDELCRIIKENI